MKLLVVAVAVLIAIVIFAGSIVRRARRVPWFHYNTGAPLTQEQHRALGAGPRWQARTLEVEPGVVVRGLERAATKPGAAWVLFFGGNSTQFLADGQGLLERLIGDREWGGLVWAYRGYDGSGGTPSPAALERDAWQEYTRLLLEQQVDSRHVHLVGFSLGTSLVAAVAARAHAEPPASITLLAPTTELDMRPPSGAYERFETLKYLPNVTAPTLIVHGGADTTLSPAGARRIAAELGNRARLIEHPALGHLDLQESELAMTDARDFILAH